VREFTCSRTALDLRVKDQAEANEVSEGVDGKPEADDRREVVNFQWTGELKIGDWQSTGLT